MVYYIVGYLGSGKSTIGKKLARKLNCPFFDTDRMVEERFNLTEFEIYSKYGADLFHQTELEALQQLQTITDAVVAVGGDLPCYGDNMLRINQHGKSIYIKMAPKSLALRLINARKKRAQIEPYTDNIARLEQFITSQIKSKEVFFNNAHYKIKGESLEIAELTALLFDEI